MPRATPASGSIIRKTRELTSRARSGARHVLGLKPKRKAVSSSIGRHLCDPEVRESLATISETMRDDHTERVIQDLREDRLSHLTRYVIYLAFLDSISPPTNLLALHPQLGDWLLALPDDHDCYYPADPCWDCGYNYPGTSDVAQAASLRRSQDPSTPRQSPEQEFKDAFMEGFNERY
jgi:hypothetical protein